MDSRLPSPQMLSAHSQPLYKWLHRQRPGSNVIPQASSTLFSGTGFLSVLELIKWVGCPGAPGTVLCPPPRAGTQLPMNALELLKRGLG